MLRQYDLSEEHALRARLETNEHLRAAKSVGWGVELREGKCARCGEVGSLTYLGLCPPDFKAAHNGMIELGPDGAWVDAGQRIVSFMIPGNLHPDTAELVLRFARQMAQKLRKSEIKSGFGNSWLNPACVDALRASLARHMAKGDPIDVANLCAMLWWHDEPTAKGDMLTAEHVTRFLSECCEVEHAPERAEPRLSIRAVELLAAFNAWLNEALTGGPRWCSPRRFKELLPMGQRSRKMGGALVYLGVALKQEVPHVD